MENNQVQGKQVTWSPDDQFILMGEEFSKSYNSLKRIVISPLFENRMNEALETIAIADTFNILQKKLDEGISSGVVKEVMPETVESPPSLN